MDKLESKSNRARPQEYQTDHVKSVAISTCTSRALPSREKGKGGTMRAKGKMDVYGIITEKILEQLDKGVIPWHQPWKSNGVGPTNLQSKKAYRGVNVWMLAVERMSQGFGSCYWMTYKQAKGMGGNVRKGEHGSMVVFWKWLEKEEKKTDGTTAITSRPMLRYYRVFNLDQVDGIPDGKVPKMETVNYDPIAECQRVIDEMPKAPNITIGGGRACYSPTFDRVTVPEMGVFESAESYYSTMFHELSHSTGHQSRLNRAGIVKNVAAFGSEEYSKEELVAEMGAAFISGHCSISNKTIESSAGYIQGWSKKLKEDRRLVVLAAAAAQKASDFILAV